MLRLLMALERLVTIAHLAILRRGCFFLAQAFTDDVVDQPEEIDSHIWVDIQQARKNCTYENDLRVIDKAELLINQSK